MYRGNFPTLIVRDLAGQARNAPSKKKVMNKGIRPRPIEQSPQGWFWKEYEAEEKFPSRGTLQLRENSKETAD